MCASCNCFCFQSRTRLTNAQKEGLVDIMKDKFHILYGKRCSAETKNGIWQALSDELNMFDGGAVKTHFEWKNSFEDFRIRISKKRKRMRQQQSGDGDGSFNDVEELTDLEQRMVDMEDSMPERNLIGRAGSLTAKRSRSPISIPCAVRKPVQVLQQSLTPLPPDIRQFSNPSPKINVSAFCIYESIIHM